VQDQPENHIEAATIAPRWGPRELFTKAKLQEDSRLNEEMSRLMLFQESHTPRACQYLEHHQTLDPGMRSVLVDWLMEVCREFEMQRESFYLSVAILDRFLSRVHDVHQSRLQLVGVAAVLVAAKIEEIYPPKAHEFALITDGAFSTNELRKMEECMLEKLDWDVYYVTPFRWILHYLRRLPPKLFKNGCAKETMCEIMAHLDLAILDYNMLSYQSSELACAALVHYVDLSPSTLRQVTGLAHENINPCVEWLGQFSSFVQPMLDAKNSPGWCCQGHKLWRNTVHNKDVHLVQPYFPDAIENLEAKLWKPARQGCQQPDCET